MKRLKQLKQLSLTLLVCIAAFAAFVIYTNRNSVNMTPRQKILKTVYPALMWISRLTKKNTHTIENKHAQPHVSLYDLQTTANDGSLFTFGSLKGKKILIVNTASDCGYTDQFAELQKLYEQHKDKLLIIGFPANDFKEQEKGSDEEIAAFCKKNYGVSFPLMQKSVVIKSPEQNPVFQWLTDLAKNGWNSKGPSWNFSKYLIDEEGKLVNYFGHSVSPLSEELLTAITQ